MSVQPFTAVFTGAASCVTLAAQIIDLLNTAKANKAEFNSLLAAVQGIHAFLLELPTDGITSQGNRVLAQLHANLLGAHGLLQRVSRMGPLLSLVRAYSVRDEFLRVNKDIVNTFGILAAGEQLLVLAKSRVCQEQQAKQIQAQLQRAQSEFFVQEEAALNKLRDVAAAGQHASWPEQLLQRRLLDQLQALPWLTELNPQQLLEEYRALQMMALYNGDSSTAAGADAAAGDDDDDVAEVSAGRDQSSSKKKGGMDAEMEEFLVQQVCAALAATVAASSQEPLAPPGAPAPPSDFLCPISGELMVRPVMLVETGHSYEAAHIRRWLDSHDTCPISRKQLVTNYNLQKAVASWAAEHGINLPPAPVYQSLHEGVISSNSLAAAAAAAGHNTGRGSGESLLLSPFAGPTTEAAGAGGRSRVGAQQLQQQQEQQQGGLPSKDTSSVVIDQMPSVGPAPAEPHDSGKDISNISFVGMGRKDRSKRKGCTRTRWALGLTALLLLAVAGVAAGVGVYFNEKNKAARATQAPLPVSATPGLVANSTSPSPSPPADAVPINTTLHNSPSPSPSPDVVPGPVNSTKETSPTPGACGTHIINQGDSFWGLSQRLGFSLNDIIAVNPGVVPESLQLGQRVKLPCTANSTSPLPQPQQELNGTCGAHTIKEGDSFFALSVQRGFSVDDMIAVNPGVVPENLQIGQRVNLPCTDAVNSTASEPQLQPEATAFTVALQQHVPQQDFDCNTGKPFCQLCNRTVADVANTCTRYTACVAFVIDQQTGCGYLKASATTLAASANHVTYCLDGRGAACAGTFAYYPQTDLKDVGDFSCNQRDRLGRPQDFCFEYGRISTVGGACLLNSGCEGFVTAERDRQAGGYLKNVTEPRSFGVETDLYVKHS